MLTVTDRDSYQAIASKAFPDTNRLRSGDQMRTYNGDEDHRPP